MHEKAQKRKEKKLTFFFIKKYGQPICLKCVSLRAFLRLFVAIFPSSWLCLGILKAPKLKADSAPYPEVCLDFSKQVEDKSLMPGQL
jgi:hypothetical protein